MGALSSWATFALSHHLILQFIASRLGYDRFEDYALLGDDIVIANKDVAEAYYNFMTQTFGVKINLSKSVMSEHGHMEFAKRLVTPTEEISPVGPKNIMVGLKSPAHIPTLILDYISKGGRLDDEQIDTMLKEVSTSDRDLFRLTKRKAEILLYNIIGPFGFIDTGRRLGPAKVEDSLSKYNFISKDANVVERTTHVLRDTCVSLIQEELVNYRAKTIESIQHLLKWQQNPTLLGIKDG